MKLNYMNLKIRQSLAESVIGNFDIMSPLENQIQKQETKISGWRFDKTISLTICFRSLLN